MKLLFTAIFLLFATLAAVCQDTPMYYNGCEVKIDNKWIRQDSGTPPVNTDTLLFEQSVSMIKYPNEALRMGVEGDVVCLIEISKEGELVGYSIEKNIGAGTVRAVSEVLSALPVQWKPATIDNKNVESRVRLLFKYHLDKLSRFNEEGYYWKSYVIMAIGGGKWTTVNAKNLERKNKKK